MTQTDIPRIQLYSDGGAEPNPGRGGFGVILVDKGVKKEFRQGYTYTTNNRMELMGVIHGLEQLKTKSNVRVFTDSGYVISGIEKGWAKRWRTNNWYRTKTQKAINHDLWAKLLDLIAAHEKVSFYWVKGHSGHIENERCDELATEALIGNKLIEDTVYLSTLRNNGRHRRSTRTGKMSRATITREGDRCKKCRGKVTRQSNTKTAVKPGQNYYFEYYFLCPNCKSIYLPEDAKRNLTEAAGVPFTKKAATFVSK